MPDSTPPRSDLVTFALVGLVAAGIVMAFVLTQQHEPIPGWLDALIVGGLTSLGFYKAASPGQQQAVAKVAAQVDALGTAVDLNHLDTMQRLDATPAEPELRTAPLTVGPGGATTTDAYMHRTSPDAPPPPVAPMLWADPQPEPGPEPTVADITEAVLAQLRKAQPAARPVAFVSHPSAPPLAT